MNRFLASAGLAVAGLSLAGSLAACQPGSSHSAARASARAIATSTAVRADEARVKALVKSCHQNNSGKTAFEACLKNSVPRAARVTLGKCLVTAALRGKTSFETTGAEACVAGALPKA